jgi:hypothetical protein
MEGWQKSTYWRSQELQYIIDNVLPDKQKDSKWILGEKIFLSIHQDEKILKISKRLRHNVSSMALHLVIQRNSAQETLQVKPISTVPFAPDS